MTTKTYGQYCGVARALELVGERWALLIVRDLLVGPKRYTDLRSGLPKIPTNVLATRLKELESAGLVERNVQPRPSGAIVYELTPYGLDLEPVVLALGRWGARSLGELRPGEIATADSLVMALRSTYHPPKRGTGKQRSGTPGFTPCSFSFTATSTCRWPPFGTWNSRASSGNTLTCLFAHAITCDWMVSSLGAAATLAAFPAAARADVATRGHLLMPAPPGGCPNRK